MRTTRLIIAPLAAAALAVAGMTGPAGAVPADTHNASHGSHAGKSTIKGSQQSDPATADVYVPPAELSGGDATAQSAAPRAWPANPEPITGPDAVVNPPASGLDWGSAGIGAAAGIGAFAIALALTTGLRRRRTVRPGPLMTR
jgi:hypothetical protein